MVEAVMMYFSGMPDRTWHDGCGYGVAGFPMVMRMGWSHPRWAVVIDRRWKESGLAY